MTNGYHWMLDELASAGRENLDTDHASQYDAKEDAHAVDEVALLKGLSLNRRSTVVDIGAGTGQFSLAVAPECARVVAADVSPIMLAVLKAKAAALHLSNLEIVQAGFLTYEHEGEPADLVYSRYALHHLPDFWKALALQRIRRIIRTGGLFRLWDIVYNFDAAQAEARLDAWCATLDTVPGSGPDGDAEGGWTRADIEEHIRDEHSTFTWLLEPMMERCGFQIEDAEYSEDGIFARYIVRAV